MMFAIVESTCQDAMVERALTKNKSASEHGKRQPSEDEELADAVCEGEEEECEVDAMDDLEED